MLTREFKLKPSKQYQTFLSVLILASLAIMLCLPIVIWLKALGILFIIGYGAHVFWRFGLLRSQYSIISLKRNRDGSWQLSTQKQVYQGELMGESTVSGVVSVLRFRSTHAWPKTCIIFRDSLEQGKYRQLLVTLKMG